MSLFADTSAWYAAADSGDRSHARAINVLGAGERLITTDHIFFGDMDPAALADSSSGS